MEGIRHKVGILSLSVLAVLTSVTTLPSTGEATTTPSVSFQRATEVDGVPLTPITGAQRAHCQSYAAKLKRPVVCPGLLPTPIPISAAPGGVCSKGIGEDQCGPAIFQSSENDGLFINQANFQVPPGYVGVPGLPSISGGSLGHFVLVEGPVIKWYEGSGSATKVVVSVPSTCKVSPLVKPIRIHGAAAKFYECANGPMTPDTPALYLGHDLLTWRERGLLVEVSFHGHSSVNQDLDVAVAKAAIVVAPKRSKSGSS